MYFFFFLINRGRKGESRERERERKWRVLTQTKYSSVGKAKGTPGRGPFSPSDINCGQATKASGSDRAHRRRGELYKPGCPSAAQEPARPPLGSTNCRARRAEESPELPRARVMRPPPPFLALTAGDGHRHGARGRQRSEKAPTCPAGKLGGLGVQRQVGRSQARARGGAGEGPGNRSWRPARDQTNVSGERN